MAAIELSRERCCCSCSTAHHKSLSLCICELAWKLVMAECNLRMRACLFQIRQSSNVFWAGGLSKPLLMLLTTLSPLYGSSYAISCPNLSLRTLCPTVSCAKLLCCS